MDNRIIVFPALCPHPVYCMTTLLIIANVLRLQASLIESSHIFPHQPSSCDSLYHGPLRDPHGGAPMPFMRCPAHHSREYCSPWHSMPTKSFSPAYFYRFLGITRCVTPRLRRFTSCEHWSYLYYPGIHTLSPLLIGVVNHICYPGRVPQYRCR